MPAWFDDAERRDWSEFPGPLRRWASPPVLPAPTFRLSVSPAEARHRSCTGKVLGARRAESLSAHFSFDGITFSARPRERACESLRMRRPVTLRCPREARASKGGGSLRPPLWRDIRRSSFEARPHGEGLPPSSFEARPSGSHLGMTVEPRTTGSRLRMTSAAPGSPLPRDERMRKCVHRNAACTGVQTL